MHGFSSVSSVYAQILGQYTVEKTYIFFIASTLPTKEIDCMTVRSGTPNIYVLFLFFCQCIHSLNVIGSITNSELVSEKKILSNFLRFQAILKSMSQSYICLPALSFHDVTDSRSEGIISYFPYCACHPNFSLSFKEIVPLQKMKTKNTTLQRPRCGVIVILNLRFLSHLILKANYKGWSSKVFCWHLKL